MEFFKSAKCRTIFLYSSLYSLLLFCLSSIESILIILFSFQLASLSSSAEYQAISFRLSCKVSTWSAVIVWLVKKSILSSFIYLLFPFSTPPQPTIHSHIQCRYNAIALINQQRISISIYPRIMSRKSILLCVFSYRSSICCMLYLYSFICLYYSLPFLLLSLSLCWMPFFFLLLFCFSK